MDCVTKGGSTPIIDVFSQASADLVDVHLSVVFQAFHSEKSYLRIQGNALTGTISSVDVATTKNLDDLVKVGEELLKKPVAMVNLDTGKYEASNSETNAEVLVRFAKLLSQERQLRHTRSPNGHAHGSHK